MRRTDPTSSAYMRREGDKSHEVMYKFYEDVFNNDFNETKTKQKRERVAGFGTENETAAEHNHIAPLMEPSSASGTPLARERAR